MRRKGEVETRVDMLSLRWTMRGYKGRQDDKGGKRKMMEERRERHNRFTFILTQTKGPGRSD